MSTNAIRLVVFDWAGTTIDFGSCAPVQAFVEVLERRGVKIDHHEARVPMGTHKKEHLRRLLHLPGVGTRWRQASGQDWTEGDIEEMYRELTPLQLEAVERHGDLVPGVVDCVAELRRRGIKIGGTTGYFHAAAARCLELAKAQGYLPDANVCGDDVPAGRPAPWMIFRLMEALRVYPPAAVVKVGDTVVDIEEGLNAGCWSVAVIDSGNEFGLTLEQFRRLSEEEREARRATARARLLAAGAHAVINTLAELPGVVERLSGERGA